MILNLLTRTEPILCCWFEALLRKVSTYSLCVSLFFQFGDLRGAQLLGTCGVEPFSEGYAASAEVMRSLLETLRSDVEHTLRAGGAKAVARHHARGKLLPRERLGLLLDPGSPFLELSQLAGRGMYGHDDVPCGGVVTGVGSVHGRLVAVVANDATVKGGTYWPITVKARMYWGAGEAGGAALPCRPRWPVVTSPAWPAAACRSTCGYRRLQSSAPCPASTWWTRVSGAPCPACSASRLEAAVQAGQACW